MSRIRTVKPELFKHEGLFELEEDTGLPVRLAFVGLFTVCDREGRFKWRPRTLKLDVMPYDPVDFSRVLDALATRGFIVQYAAEDGEIYGFIPSWSKHQVINNRERDSVLPAPDLTGQTALLLTRESRVANASMSGTCQGSVEKEGKGREQEGNRKGTPSGGAGVKKSVPDGFEKFWDSFGNKMDKPAAEKAWKKAVGKESPDVIIRKAGEYHQFCVSTKTKQKYAQGWLNGECWTNDYQQQSTQGNYHGNFQNQDYTAGTEGFRTV